MDSRGSSGAEVDVKSRETVAFDKSLQWIAGDVEQERKAAGGRLVRIYLMLESHREQQRARELATERGYADAAGTGSGPSGDAGGQGYRHVSSKDLVREELVAALDMPTRRVGDMIDLAITLHERARAVLEAMLAGLIDETRARRILQRLRGVECDETCDRIAREVMDQYTRERAAGRLFSTEAVRTMVDEAVAQH
ncbi:MAG: hypothetical protein Q4G67_15530, partial [Actinomycetia bacterium]|nr:hypothetical protein [Actinomycetes bacterium]